jgi:uncharacterized protein (TIGR00251 family)
LEREEAVMQARQAGSGVLLSARVKAGSGSFSVSSEGDIITIRTKSPAEDNKANQEIIKNLSRLFGKEVRIIRGLRSRNKTLFVEGASAGEVEKALGH